MTFTLVSFNAHAGLQPRRDGVCLPYDLAGVLEGFDADVFVVQETWWPDGGEPSAVQVAAERIGAKVFELPFGRATLHPWPHVRTDGSGQGTVGISAVLSRLPARVLGQHPVRARARRTTHPSAAACTSRSTSTARRVDLVGVHLTSRLPYGPPMQLRRLRAQAPSAGRARQSSPATATSGGRACTAFLPGWRRAVRGRTWPAGRPHSQIDHVLVRRGPTSRHRRRRRGAPRRRLGPPPGARHVRCSDATVR